MSAGQDEHGNQRAVALPRRVIETATFSFTVQARQRFGAARAAAPPAAEAIAEA